MTYVTLKLSDQLHHTQRTHLPPPRKKTTTHNRFTLTHHLSHPVSPLPPPHTHLIHLSPHQSQAHWSSPIFEGKKVDLVVVY